MNPDNLGLGNNSETLEKTAEEFLSGNFDVSSLFSGESLILVGVFLVVFLIFFIIGIDAWGRISRKCGLTYGYGAASFILSYFLIGIFMLPRIAGKSPAFGFLMLIPFVNIWAIGALFAAIAKKRNKTPMLYGIGMFVPLLNIILFFYLAYGK